MMYNRISRGMLAGCLMTGWLSAAHSQEAGGIETPTDEPTWTVPDAAAEEAIPKAYSTDRYQAAWAKNPFMLKTVAVVQARESFAKDWALAGISSYKGVFTVRLVNKQTGTYERLKEGEDSGEMKIVAVNYHKDRSQSSVEISKGSETATLGYDDGLLARPVTVNNTQGAPPPPAGSVPPGAAPPNGRMDPRLQAQLQARAQQGGAPGGGQGVPPSGNLAGGNGGTGTTFIPGVGQVPVNDSAPATDIASPNRPLVVTPGSSAAGNGSVNGGGNPNPAVQIDPNTGAVVPSVTTDPSVAPQPVTRRRQLIPQPINSN